MALEWMEEAKILKNYRVETDTAMLYYVFLGMTMMICIFIVFFFFQAEDGIRDVAVTGVQTCALPISERKRRPGERDRFLWFCVRCHAKVHEVVFEVRDYAENPVSVAYREYYGSVERSEERRVGKECRSRGATDQ